MNPIAHMVQQLQNADTRQARRSTSDRITPELRAEVMTAIQAGDTTRKIRATFGISHTTLVKIREDKP